MHRGAATAEHDHDHATAEGGWAPSRPGSVTLDIGAGTGALVVLVPAELAGHELEVEPEGAAPVHTAVRERLLPGGTVQAAVFPALPAGAYRVRVRGGGEHHQRTQFPLAHVRSGHVAEIAARTG